MTRFALALLLCIPCACAPVGGSGRNVPVPTPDKQDADQEHAQKLSPMAQAASAGLRDYRVELAAAWRDAAAETPPAEDWGEAFARVQARARAGRDKAFAEFTAEVDKAAAGWEFTPKVFSELAEQVAKSLEEGATK
jgi:hypothetical protein